MTGWMECLDCLLTCCRAQSQETVKTPAPVQSFSTTMATHAAPLFAMAAIAILTAMAAIVVTAAAAIIVTVVLSYTADKWGVMKLVHAS